MTRNLVVATQANFYCILVHMFVVISINNEPSSTLSSGVMFVKFESNCLIYYRYSFILIGFVLCTVAEVARGACSTASLVGGHECIEHSF